MNPDFRGIPGSETWVSAELLNKGWSQDKKFVILDENGDRFLLRISAPEMREKKEKQFEMLKRAEKLEIHVSRPISFGILDSKEPYLLLSYLEGRDARDVVFGMPEGEAYRLGTEAGILLSRLHSIPVVTPESTWGEKYARKIPRKIRAMKECPLDIPEADLLIRYVLEHMALVSGREQKFAHGDYHVGNLLVGPDGKIGVIDFDKNGVADPYDEFKPFFWNVEANPAFERGLIDGYFGGNIPADFFPVLSLYAAESLISFFPWALPFGEEEIRTGRRILEKTLDWYDRFERIVPSWYSK